MSPCPSPEFRIQLGISKSMRSLNRVTPQNRKLCLKTKTKRYGGDPGIEKMNTKNSKMCLQVKENKQFQVNYNGLKFWWLATRVLRLSFLRREGKRFFSPQCLRSNFQPTLVRTGSQTWFVLEKPIPATQMSCNKYLLVTIEWHLMSLFLLSNGFLFLTIDFPRNLFSSYQVGDKTHPLS